MPKRFPLSSLHSTKLALVHFLDEIYQLFAQNNYVAGIFLDLAKAFDSIPHYILIAKLHHYGIRGVMLSWFKSYLTNRMQYVNVNGHRSSSDHITYGVPQGSVLGPLLFLIFINDIGFLNLSNLKPKLFADDTNAFVHSLSLTDLAAKSQNAMDNLAEWITANKLSINYDKTCYIVFSPKHSRSDDLNLNLTLNQLSIKRVPSSTYLGVIIDVKFKLEITNL